MVDIERKAAFYLGRKNASHLGSSLSDEPLMYDARDLTTHAVCIGMTGSGKTGLGMILLEEAALDGIPSIIIDPKGDMTNLLLTFPDLLPSDFQPWINADDARRKGLSADEYAAATAQMWSNGLADWGQSGERVRRLKQSAEFVIYTPGSDAGIPISVLQTFKAPDLSWDDEEEIIRELISGTVSGLLGLAGISADPIRSREHILLAHIFEHAWRRGQDLDLANLIGAIQNPPIQKLGVFDLDVFYPERDRFKLAMALNSVVASPSFENWLEGVPLDIARLSRTPEGKPRVSVFYIAHLGEAERSFFVTLLLQQVVTWMRRLSGTTSLRCLLYFDEVFGYFPPHPGNPPSKRPLLTLLKTARAFGVGLVLTTQNPVDLDYKGLTNAGTWFIGKLQTDRDKARVLEGMESVVSESGTMLDRAHLDRLISSLGSRMFILHNVHEERPILFGTRWALSYLRGPLTRSQVRKLMKPTKDAVATEATQPMAVHAATLSPSKPEEIEEIPEGYTPVRPRVHARVAQYFLPVDISKERAGRELAAGRSSRGPRIRAAHLVYEPYLVGIASMLYSDSGRTRVKREQALCILPLPEGHSLVDWDHHVVESLKTEDLDTTTYEDALFSLLPDGMTESPPYTRFRDAFVDYVYREHSLPVWVHPRLKLRSALDESEREFRVRCQEAAREQRDQELDKVEQRFERDIDRLRDRLKREERELEEDLIDHRGRKQEELLSLGETVFSFFSSRRRSRSLSTASRKRRMTQKAKADVRESEEEIERLEEEIADMREERKEALEEVRSKWADVALQVQESSLRPKKADIHLEAFGLAWVPHWMLAYEDESGAERQEQVLAYPLS